MPFRPSPATRRQLDWLNQRFGTDQTVLTLAVDRLYQSERSTMNTETVQSIEWHTNLPDLWQDEPEEGVDVEASERRYVEMVEAALQAAYPDAEIITNTHQATGWSRPVAVNGVEGSVEGGAVEDVIGQVYQGWEWLVTESE